MDFPINTELVETTTKLKEERRVLAERLEKIEASQSEVSAAVYERVSKDYRDKHNTATAALIAKKGEVDKELATLYETKTKLATNVETHQGQVEEVKFRQTLGEFADEAAYTAELNAAQEKLDKFSTLLGAVISNIERYEALFADEPDMQPEPAPSAPAEEVPLESALSDVTGTASQPGYELESNDGDYFGDAKPAGGETCVFKPAELDEDTLVGPPPTQVEGSMLLVLQGEAGASEFALQEKTTIGRSNTNTIPLQDAKISRQHAVLKHNGTYWTIADMQSSNGVLVNGKKIDTARLRNGDKIQIGGFVLQLQVT